MEHEEFSSALKKGKDPADSRVERSLYHRAIGYSYDAVKIFMPAGKDKPVIVPYREHVPPDTVACIFWLKNRRREEWRDKQEVDHSGSLQIKDLSLEEIWQRIAEELEKLGPMLNLEAIRDRQGIENRIPVVANGVAEDEGRPNQRLSHQNGDGRKKNGA